MRFWRIRTAVFLLVLAGLLEGCSTPGFDDGSLAQGNAFAPVLDAAQSAEPDLVVTTGAAVPRRDDGDAVPSPGRLADPEVPPVEDTPEVPLRQSSQEPADVPAQALPSLPEEEMAADPAAEIARAAR